MSGRPARKHRLLWRQGLYGSLTAAALASMSESKPSDAGDPPQIPEQPHPGPHRASDVAHPRRIREVIPRLFCMAELSLAEHERPVPPAEIAAQGGVLYAVCTRQGQSRFALVKSDLENRGSTGI